MQDLGSARRQGLGHDGRIGLAVPRTVLDQGGAGNAAVCGQIVQPSVTVGSQQTVAEGVTKIIRRRIGHNDLTAVVDICLSIRLGVKASQIIDLDITALIQMRSNLQSPQFRGTATAVNHSRTPCIISSQINRFDGCIRRILYSQRHVGVHSILDTIANCHISKALDRHSLTADGIRIDVRTGARIIRSKGVDTTRLRYSIRRTRHISIKTICIKIIVRRAGR